MAQTLNIRGFVAGIEIEPDEFLLPLQEAIVNSIQSIEDKTPSEGRISIKIIRGKQLPLSEDFDIPYNPIVGFEIYDDGVGFINERFQAFNDAFTDLNKGKGCKGVGRYTVLACFGSMEINSTFHENDRWNNRTFKFDVINGINPENDGNLTATSKEELITIVKLKNYKPIFQDYINKRRIGLEDVARGVIEHCLLYFVSDEIPEIRIYNEDDVKNSVFINDQYRTVVKFDREVKTIKLENVETSFNLNYLRNYINKTHSVHLCANKREVGKKVSIATYIPSFVQSLQDEGGIKYYLSIYVTGEYLDEKSNYQRNKFAIPQKNDDKTPFDEISIEELLTDISDNGDSSLNCV
jgi:hypothetical protein